MVLYTFDVDNRKLRIIYKPGSVQLLEKCNPDIKDTLNKMIVSISKDCPLSKHFSCLNFVIYTSQSGIIRNLFFRQGESNMGTLAYVSPESNERIFPIGVVKSYNTVYIHADSLEKTYQKMKGDYAPYLKETLIHELSHLWHNQISVFSSLIKVEKRIKAIPLDYPMDINIIYKRMRVLLFNILQLVIIEGIAKFGQKFFNNDSKMVFTDEILGNQYIVARDKVKIPLALMNEWFNFLSQYNRANKSGGKNTFLSIISTKSVGLVKELHKPDWMYYVGTHMIFTILYTDKDTDFAELVAMDYIPIIRKYEACMRKRGFKPLISYNSGEGVIDYSDMLERLMTSYEHTKECANGMDNS